MTLPAQPLPLEELRALAEKCLQYTERAFNHECVINEHHEALCALRDMTGPTTILALLDRLKAAEQSNATNYKAAQDALQKIVELADEKARLKRQLAECDRYLRNIKGLPPSASEAGQEGKS